jgi:predicted transposase YdaD
VRLLYERNWSKSRILGFFAVLDWMMRLPEELETELWHDIESIEGERRVKYVTSLERLAIKRGIEQGIEQGLARGRMEGRAEGIAVLLARQLNRRFGPLSVTITDRLAKAAPDQLERWAERVLDAATLDDVFAES